MTDRATEFEAILEAISYEITTARGIGPADPERMRTIVKRIRDLATDLDALSVSIVAEDRDRT
jgi:adenylosuccinate synthase